VPERFAAKRLDPIVRERAEWLYDAIVRMQETSETTVVDLERGDPIRWLGRWVPTQLERAGARPVITLDETIPFLTIRVPEHADPHDALVQWYRKEARSIFESRVAAWSVLFDLTPGAMSVREQRTRWGSCTHRGDLSFNWRLVLAPLWVLDSIVVHELCHIDELNHSDRFWALLDERYPRHREASEWLREFGPVLRVSRPTARHRTPEPRVQHEPVVAMRRPRRGKRAKPLAGQGSLF
jgi:predicted metal-dependent hydrolase